MPSSRLKKQHPTDPKRWFGYRELSETILENKDLIAQAKKEVAADTGKKIDAKFISWYQEAQELYPEVYPRYKDEPAVKDSSYCLEEVPGEKEGVEGPKYKKDDLPKLDEAYGLKALQVAERQLAKAGLRLANQIIELSQNPSFKENDATMDELVTQIEAINTESKVKKKSEE